MAEIDKIPVERFVAVMRQNAHLVRVDIEGNDVIVRKDSIIKDIYSFEDGFINRKFVLRAANKFGVSTHLFF
ncbi:MAG: hypothetical protein F4X32_07160 [Candidatus Dadabacteria bacterium]|nr:hypothetical protein [Candidatus Dadabacteria bacterium]MYB27256.1 hypothetical protein [Candidatus Dadabacteria bacterium]